MRRLLIGMMLAALTVGGQAVEPDSVTFRSPFDFPLLLSANFGELRPNHFHDGIDIKTEGVTGKPIYSIADGYVSRVLVQHGGYGQAVYVTHPNGYTSVYGHIVAFAPAVQAFLREYQYAHETFVCDVPIEPDRFPVKQGELIALSGNEGASAGPHLHLELRRTADGTYVNPLPFFRHLLTDTKAPVPGWVGFYPVKGKGVVNGATAKKIVPVSALNQVYTAWGELYTAISAKDYMDGTANHYGVHSVTLYVDDVEVFNSTTDEVAPDENRRINGFIDYEDWWRNRRLLMRSGLLPGNRLRLIRTAAQRGIVTIDEERDYHFRYELEDDFGNRKTCRFTVRGKRQDIPESVPTSDRMLCWNKANVIQEPGMELVVPKGYVYEDVELRTQVKGDTSGISSEYVLDMGRHPLHGYCDLSIGIRHFPVADLSKYYIVQQQGTWRASMGGTVTDDGWVKAKVRELGTFAVAVDTVPPRVTPVGQNTWRTRRNLRFTVSDAETGIASYKVYVDGEFVLFARKGSTLAIVDPERIRKGVPHTAEVVVTDGCGNETRKAYRF